MNKTNAMRLCVYNFRRPRDQARFVRHLLLRVAFAGISVGAGAFGIFLWTETIDSCIIFAT